VINNLIVFRSASSTNLLNATRVGDDVLSAESGGVIFVVVAVFVLTGWLVLVYGDVDAAVFALPCFLFKLLGPMMCWRTYKPRSES
jgi:hypothetical protein